MIIVRATRWPRRLVVQNLVPLPLGVALNGLRMLRHSAWNAASQPTRVG